MHLHGDVLLVGAGHLHHQHDLVGFVEDVDQRLAHVCHHRPFLGAADVAEALHVRDAVGQRTEAETVHALSLVAHALDSELPGAGRTSARRTTGRRVR